MSTPNDPITCFIREQGFTNFLACLSIGTLYAIQTGAIPADAAIWTIATPKFWKPISHFVPQEIIDILSSSDELDALKEINPQEFEKVVLESISVLLSQIKHDPNNRLWDIEWNRNAN